MRHTRRAVCFDVDSPTLRALAQSVFEATLPSVMVQVFDRPFAEDLDMTRALARGVELGTPAI